MMSELAATWNSSSLTDAQRSSWNSAAAPNQSGFNLFVLTTAAKCQEEEPEIPDV